MTSMASDAYHRAYVRAVCMVLVRWRDCDESVDHSDYDSTAKGDDQ